MERVFWQPRYNVTMKPRFPIWSSGTTLCCVVVADMASRGSLTAPQERALEHVDFDANAGNAIDRNEIQAAATTSLLCDSMLTNLEIVAVYQLLPQYFWSTSATLEPTKSKLISSTLQTGVIIVFVSWPSSDAAGRFNWTSTLARQLWKFCWVIHASSKMIRMKNNHRSYCGPNSLTNKAPENSGGNCAMHSGMADCESSRCRRRLILSKQNLECRWA